MKLSSIPLVREIGSLLYWTMLAACTVGPGTVVTCSRAGSEYGLSLIWSLVFASILAFTLQEGSARLTIVSGMSLGQCLRVKYKHTAQVYDVAVVCWLVVVCVVVGNTLIEANCWAGGIDAIFALPGIQQTTAVRVGCCVGYAVIVMSLLYWDKTDKLGIFLGIVMISMAILFAIVVFNMSVDMPSLGWGLIPNIPPKREMAAEPVDIILSLVGTTSLGFNLFLGASMAEGKELKSAQRGIGFSTICAFLVSALILIVGSVNFGSNERFEIADISAAIEEFFGAAGVIVFAVGFIAAALSSMLAVALGAALTADSIFSTNKMKHRNSLADTVELQAKEVEADHGGAEEQKEHKFRIVETESEGKPMARWIYLSILFFQVLVSTVVISINVDRTVVVLVAQVFNGCLLPFFSICLLLCINDQSFMVSSPQKGWGNVFLTVSVTITLFLASNVVVQKLLGAYITVYVKYGIAACVVLVIEIALLVLTSLGKDLLRSFRHSCWTNTPQK